MATLLLLSLTACGSSGKQQSSQVENMKQEQTEPENTQTGANTV